MSARRNRAAAGAAANAQTPLLARSDATPPGPRRPSRRGCFRLLSIFAFVALLYLLFFHGSSAPSTDPSKSRPEPVKGQHVRRVVAVGDLHGDYDNALKVLHMADVVDENGSWTGNIDYFVQTGDIVDRGDDTIKLYRWFETLRDQARNAGGMMFSHMGNHEFMNALGDWRYVPTTEIKTFGCVAERQTAFSTGFIGAAWAANYTVASRVPLHPASGAPFTDYTPSSSDNALSHASLSFMHGGLSPGFAHASPYPSAINALGSTLLRRCRTRTPQPTPHPPGPYLGLPPGATSAEEELYNANGPLWYRGWATDGEKAVCGRVDGVLRKIGVRRLIMGHTPNFQKIVSRCGGKIIIIDTGISKAYGGVLSALSITYTLTPVITSFSSFNVSSSPFLSEGEVEQTVEGSASSEPSSSVESRRYPPSKQGMDTALDAEETTSTPANAEDDARSSMKGKGKWKWIEKEEVVAVYPGRRVELVVDERQVEGDFW